MELLIPSGIKASKIQKRIHDDDYERKKNVNESGTIWFNDFNKLMLRIIKSA